MQGISYKSGIMKLEKDFVYSPELPIAFTVDVKKKPTIDSYGNTNWTCSLKIGGFDVKTIICGDKKLRGSHSKKGTSVTIFGGENDEFIKLIIAINAKVEAVTEDHVKKGELPRAFSSPFNTNGPVYQASNAEYKKKLEDAKEAVADKPLFYGLNATIYPVATKYAKIKISKKVGKSKTTLLKDSEDWQLTAKEVLRYQKIASEFAKSKNKADSIYNAKIFANTYGAATFKDLVAAAEIATNKRSEDEDIAKAKAFIATHGRFPLMEDIKAIFEYTSGIAIKLKVPFKLGDCNINKHSLTFKFVAEEVFIKDADNTDQASDEFMGQYDVESDDENESQEPRAPSFD